MGSQAQHDEAGLAQPLSGSSFEPGQGALVCSSFDLHLDQHASAALEREQEIGEACIGELWLHFDHCHLSVIDAGSLREKCREHAVAVPQKMGKATGAVILERSGG